MRHANGLRAAIGGLAVVGLLATTPGHAVAQDGSITLTRDTEIEAILHDEADPIFAAANLDPAKVRIHLVEDPSLNAFTGAGFNLFINTGLIIETDSPNQLIGVVAHETGHMAGGDVAHSGAMGHAALGPMLAGLAMGVLAAAAGAPDAAVALLYSGGYFGQLSVLGYSREQESRADQAAVTYLEKSGESARGLVDFFNNFRYQEVFSDDRKFPFFRDHPLTDERIEALSGRASQQPHFNTSDPAERIAEHAIMRAKLIGFLAGAAEVMNRYPASDTSFPARYARAIAAYKATDTASALKQIDALIAERPADPYLYELKGQVLFEAGRAADAEAPYRKSVELKPDAPLLQINLAQTLIAENKPAVLDEAIAHLRLALAKEPEDTLGWRLLSEAYDSRGEDGRARLAAAEQNFNVGLMLGQMGDEPDEARALKDARIFAVRARDKLEKNTPEWRRATDIFLASGPSKDDMKVIGGAG